MSEKKSKKINLQSPSGTLDRLPEDMDKLRWITRVIEDQFQKYGYQQIDIPMYDFFELYKIRSGEKIIDDIFTFYDPPKHRAKDPELYALRPEFTAPFVRFYNSSELMYRPKPQKYFYVGPCFRYDEPTKGRYRQFTQAGIELFGADTPQADAEIMIVALDLMKTLGIEDYLLRISDLTILRTYLEEMGFDVNLQNKIFGVIDKISSLLRKLEIGAITDVTEAEFVDDYYAMMGELEVSREITEKLENLLLLVGTETEVMAKLLEIFASDPKTIDAINSSNLPKVCEFIRVSGNSEFVADCGIARGLDYYTNVVFEIDVPALGKEKQVCGGGRYNSLVREFGGEDSPATGFAFGVERLIISMEKQGKIDPGEYRSDILIAAKPAALLYAIEVAQKLRNKGFRVETDLKARSFKSAGKFVNRMKIPFLMFLGPMELESKKFTLKNFTTQDQKKDLTLTQVTEEMRSFLSK